MRLAAVRPGRGKRRNPDVLKFWIGDYKACTNANDEASLHLKVMMQYMLTNRI